MTDTTTHNYKWVNTSQKLAAHTQFITNKLHFCREREREKISGFHDDIDDNDVGGVNDELKRAQNLFVHKIL